MLPDTSRKSSTSSCITVCLHLEIPTVVSFLLKAYYITIAVMLLHYVGDLHKFNICFIIRSIIFIILFYIPKNGIQAPLPILNLKLLHR
jgi:hypothetical protein